MIEYSKRNLAADMAAKTGLLGLVEHFPQRGSLIILTYHRIGDPDGTPYDPGVFSATANDLDRQISFLKKRFRIIGLDETLHFAQKGSRGNGAAVLLTFDDGYLDNYQIAFDVLRSHGVQGLFFLPTEHIENGTVPWWDAIAYAIRHTKVAEIRLEYPRAEFSMRAGWREVLDQVLSLFKGPGNQDSAKFLKHLAEACDVELPTTDNALFMNWTQAREMIKGGMAIGSHTHTHRILAKLPTDEQMEELSVSRAVLQQELGTAVWSISYPVGGVDCFSETTLRCAETAGYKLGFSFYGGVNLPGRTNCFNLRRLTVAMGHSFTRFRSAMALSAMAGKDWSF